MLINMAQLSGTQAYFTLAQTIIPRPIAWVLTANADGAEGAYNLAPFSFFNAITGDPPIVMFTLGKKPTGEDKDTLVNIQRQQQFVVHIAGHAELAALNQSSATLGYGQSEVEASQLKLLDFESSVLPRLECAPIALFCELVRLDEIGNTPQKLVFGEVKSIWIDDAVIDHASESPFRLKVNAEKVDPLERLGGAEYASMGVVSSLQRPD